MLEKREEALGGPVLTMPSPLARLLAGLEMGRGMVFPIKL